MALRRRPHRLVSASAPSIALAFALAAISCGKSDERHGPPLRRRGIGPAAAGLQQHLAAPNDPTFEGDPQPTVAATATEAQPDTPAASDEAEKKPERDFSNELAQMMGSPADCLDVRPAADAPKQLDISLSTRVMPSGAVASSEVQASGLGPGELACLRRRMEGLHFAPPIEHAPFAVNGTIHLTRAPTPPAAAAPAVPDASAAAAQGDPNNGTMPLAATTQP
jgi:hypothetical protein